MWKIEYKTSVKKDLKKISPTMRSLIKRAIEEKLQEDPIKFGTPLQQNLKGCRKLRVGDDRIIYSVQKTKVTVIVIQIDHRKEIYRKG